MRLATLTVYPPEVIGEFDFADDADDDRAGVDADAHGQHGAVFLVDEIEGFDHFRGGIGDRAGTVIAVVR